MPVLGGSGSRREPQERPLSLRVGRSVTRAPGRRRHACRERRDGNGRPLARCLPLAHRRRLDAAFETRLSIGDRARTVARVATSAPVDLDRARSRFVHATKRFLQGARLQRQRVLDTSASAPRLLLDSPHEVVDLTGRPDNDLDYYVYELARLQDVAREVIKVFGAPTVVVEALDRFESAIPKLRAARNPLTHASNDARLDDVAWFSSLVRLGVDGSVECLVDPRYQHHDAAEELAEAVLGYLRAGLRR